MTTAPVRLTYREACRQALRDALLAEPRAFVMGEDVGKYGGCYGVTKGLLEEFGPQRVVDTPLAENGFVGLGIGAALAGLRPVVEIMTCNFSLLALDQILNNAATLAHMSGGQFAVPLVIRMATGGGRQLAAQHSHSLEGWYAHIPGLKVVVPATVEDARHMLAAALADPNPVLIFEHVVLYNAEGDLDPATTAVDIERARIRRPGSDLTLVTYGNGLPKCLAAAEALAADGIGAEVIDLRVLRPLDGATVLGSVSRTRRCIVVDEGWRSGSISAEIAARLAEEAFFELDAPVRRVCAREVPVPYAAQLEEAALPQVDDVVAAARALLPPRERCMADFLMPALGADMQTGKVVQWLVKPGDRVRRGDVVAVVETHKGAIDVEIFLDGVIGELLPVGQELPVGAVLATVREDREASAAQEQTVASQATVAPSPALPAAAAATASRAKVSPAARRRAAELGIAADKLPGTGPEGAVTLGDVERAAAAASAPPRRGFDAALMREAIAAAMSRSKREIPHYYLASTIDFGAAAAWLEAWNRDRPPEERLLPAALLLKATAQALAAVPRLNGFYEHGAFRPGSGIHIGWAVALRGGGLVAPAIHDADRRPLPELMSTLRDLVQRARAGNLRSSELTDPTITVTSLGERGAESVLGVIYPPQVAIVGFGRIVERPWLVEGRVVPRPVLAASLAADHRASDGHLGGLLLAAIDRALQAPGQL